MANVKLKSIFTKEDIYTILQLLKALAEGVDENDANMQAQIDELKTKIDTLKPEPEGYAVDNAGNVTIAGALKANNNRLHLVIINIHSRKWNVDGLAVRTFAYRNSAPYNSIDPTCVNPKSSYHVGELVLYQWVGVVGTPCQQNGQIAFLA